jgi:hypothetical protein
VPLALRLVPRGFVLAAVGRFQRKRCQPWPKAVFWPAICFEPNTH